MRAAKKKIKPPRASRHKVRIFLLWWTRKGIEPSNLTDANRALSQLSYWPYRPLESGLLLSIRLNADYYSILF